MLLLQVFDLFLFFSLSSRNLALLILNPKKHGWGMTPGLTDILASLKNFVDRMNHPTRYIDLILDLRMKRGG